MKRLLAAIAITSMSCGTAAVLSCTPVYAEKRVRGAKDHPQTEMPSDQNFNVGMAKYKDGDMDGAIDGFLQAIYFARNNYEPAAYYWLGMAYRNKMQDTKAIEAFKKAIEQSVNGNPDAHLHLGEVYLRNDRDGEAEEEAKNAIIEAGGPAYKAHNLYGMVLEHRGDLSGAQQHFLDALGEQPWTYTDAWMNLAGCFMKWKNWGSALSTYRDMLLSKKPLKGLDYQKIYLDMGVCLLAKGDHQGAIDNWHRCLDYNVANPEAHLQLAMLFDAENHISSAIKEYKEFVRVSDDQRRVGKAKERIGMLEQKLAPAETDPEAKPSMYMRQQSARQQQGQGAPGGPRIPRESGF